LAGATAPPAALDTANTIERIRADIADAAIEAVPILYSPKPGSAGVAATASLRPMPGETLTFSPAQAARTGKDRRWGVFLNLLAASVSAKSILELGACCGISAAYLGDTPACQQLITIEGSAVLADISRGTLSKALGGRRFEVVNALFDDALDDILARRDVKFDFVFIDGHHEKVATSHYLERVLPAMADRATVVFDDIAWSQDMRDGWLEWSARRGFAHAIDCVSVGVCLYDRAISSAAPLFWDMERAIGQRRVGSPHGWSNA
jgi:predicted O-methyltransferase YrrM